MRLVNTFDVPADIESAWQTLLNLELVAPCMPGATLTSFDGNSFTADMKVKLGPVLMSYAGEGAIISRDEASFTVVIEAKGKERQGGGGAKALVTVQLVCAGPSSTTANIDTDLTVNGKAAQFGRGLMVDVSKQIIAQFAANLAKVIDVAGASRSPANEPDSAETVVRDGAIVLATSAASAATPAPIANEPLDLSSVAFGAVLKRAVLVLIAVCLVAYVVWEFF